MTTGDSPSRTGASDGTPPVAGTSAASSVRTSPCLTIEQLEELAAGDKSNAVSVAHADACGECAEAVRLAQRNNELLRGFAKAVAPTSAGHRTEQQVVPTCEVAGYEIIEEIRRGGQGVVFKARHLATKRTVALKMLIAGPWASDRQRRRFERETELVAALRHPNIVTLYDSGLSLDGRLYLAMQYIDGSSLDEFVRSDNGPLVSRETADLGGTTTKAPRGFDEHRGAVDTSIPEILRLFSRTCEAVEHAHQRGVIHRDLKPSNILVDAEGEPHVLDFGVARALNDQDNVEARDVTQAGEFMGTFAYAPPELVSGQPDQIDTRTDVYSLGVILFELLTGDVPFGRSGTLSDTLRRINNEEPEPPSRFRRDINDEMDTIILKSLAKEKERRYQSVEALRRDIQNYLDGKPIDAKRDSTWYVLKKSIRRHRAAVTVAVAFALLLSTFAVSMGLLAHQNRQERDRANDTADQLKESVTALRIETGRTLSAGNDVGLAEETLWRAHLNPPPNWVSDQELALVGSGGPSASYWALWDLYSRAPCLASWRVAPERVGGLVLSGDGRIAALVQYDKSLVVWDVDRGRMISRPHRPEAGNIMVMNHDGSLLAMADNERGVHVVRTIDLTSIAYLDMPIDGFRTGAFSEDSSRLLTFGIDALVRVWNVGDAHLEGEISTHPEPVPSAAFHPDGQRIFVQMMDKVVLWTPVSDARELILTGPNQVSRGLAVSRDAQTIVAAFHTCIVVKNLPSDERWEQCYGARIAAMRISSDGRELLVTGGVSFVKLIDLETRSVVHTFTTARRPSLAAGFSSDGEHLVFAHNDGVVRLWEKTPQRHVHRIAGLRRSSLDVEYSQDGVWLAACGGDVHHDLQRWAIDVIHADTGKPHQHLIGHTGVVSAIAFHPNNRRLASASYDQTIRLWDLEKGETDRVFTGHTDMISSIDISPDGTKLVSGGSEQDVRLWDVETGDCLGTLYRHNGRIPHVEFSPDGLHVASTGGDGRVILYDLSAEQVLWSASPNQATIRTSCFSPDGETLATAGDDRMIRLWNVENGQLLKAWEGHGHNVFALAFHPDGRMLASTGRGSEVKLWDTRTAGCLITLTGHQDEVFSMAMHPSGRQLATGSADESIITWNLAYYDRHIAGNLEYELGTHPSNEIDVASVERLLGWSTSNPYYPFHPKE